MYLTLKFYRDDKGYGFAERDDGCDVFVHAADFARPTLYQRYVRWSRQPLVDHRGLPIDLKPGDEVFVHKLVEDDAGRTKAMLWTVPHVYPVDELYLVCSESFADLFEPRFVGSKAECVEFIEHDVGGPYVVYRIAASSHGGGVGTYAPVLDREWSSADGLELVESENS